MGKYHQIDVYIYQCEYVSAIFVECSDHLFEQILRCLILSFLNKYTRELGHSPLLHAHTIKYDLICHLNTI